MSAVFKRDHRLLDGKQFKVVFNHRQRLHGQFFSLHRLPNDLGHHRLGLAVSKKVSKKAVERNRIKRQVRESFRHLQEAASTNESDITLFDCVIVAKSGAANAENIQLRQDIDQIWRKMMR